MTALPPRQKVIPCLWFDKQAEEAVGFYVSLLPDSRIDAVIRSPGDYPSGKAGDVLLVEFTLAATLAVVPSVPVAGMALILGVDRFMSECRALTNFIGNAVATIVVAKWENGLDREALDQALAGGPTPVAVGSREADDD
ncbi:MAG: VOC family protein [Alphaproteobacteria bacterium]|nr:VOC family protein [Alphaproteobacteria bacterium]